MNTYAFGYVSTNGDVRITTVFERNETLALDKLLATWSDITPLWVGEVALNEFLSDNVREIKPLNAPQFRVAGNL